MWLTNWCMDFSTCINWERCWLQSSSVHPHDEDKETHWLQNPWHADEVASSRERWIMTNCLRSQFEWIITLNQVTSPLMALKIILIYVQGCEKRNPTQITWICVKNRLGSLNFVILDIYSCRDICRASHIKSW